MSSPEEAKVEEALGLLDVLEEVPLDVVDANTWRLLPAAARGNLRQACRRSLRLTEELTTSDKLDLLQLKASVQDEVGMVAGAASSDSAPWRAGVEPCAAFAARLPRLSKLRLLSGSSEADLTAALVHLGASTGGRLTALSLDGGALSTTGTCAIRLACPHLRDLELVNTTADPGEPPFYEENLYGMQLDGAVFEPLRSCPLVKLKLFSQTWPSALLSLSSALPRLQHLDLEEDGEDGLSAAHVQAVVALTHLQHLALDETWGPGLSLPDCAPLFALTRLTHLQLPRVCNDDDAEVRDAAAADAALHDASLALGGLVGLRSLHLPLYFVVDDAVLAGLRRLPHLTELRLSGTSAVASAAAGHLPALRRLVVHGVDTPNQLLKLLRPFLPLPSLTELSDGFGDGGADGRDGGDSGADSGGAGDRGHVTLCVDAGDGDRGGVLAMAAVWALAQHLAAAPYLPLQHLVVRGCHGGPPLLAVAQALRPLGGKVSTVTFRCQRHHVAAPGWAALGAALPLLTDVRLALGVVTDDVLAAVTAQLPALRRLRMSDSSRVTAQGWLRLARLRGEPLQLGASPAVSAALVAHCAAVQEHLHGRQNITWTGQ